MSILEKVQMIFSRNDSKDNTNPSYLNREILKSIRMYKDYSFNIDIKLIDNRNLIVRLGGLPENKKSDNLDIRTKVIRTLEILGYEYVNDNSDDGSNFQFYFIRTI